MSQAASERANLIIVSVLGGTLVLLVAGAFACILNHLPLPEYLNNATTLIAGGLIGYLGAHRLAASNVGTADVVNVEAAVATADPLKENSNG